jgi:alpha-D-xyloside xylohydrolase
MMMMMMNLALVDILNLAMPNVRAVRARKSATIGMWFAATLALCQGVAHAAVTNVRQTGTGIESIVGDSRLRVDFVTDRIVRVTATRNRDWSASASLMRTDVAEKPGPIALKEDGNAYVLHSSKITARVNRETGAVAFLNEKGELLLGENAASPHAFEKVPVIKSMPDPATIKTIKTVDGDRQVAGAYVEKKDREAWKTTARFGLHDDEALYGLGFDETSDLNLRGKTKRLYQHNLRLVVPFIVSTRGYGLLFDSYSALTFADGKEGMSVASDVVDELDYYFVLGPSMDGAIAGYRQLTGAATMLPRWAFGYVQSKERYMTQQDVIDTVKQFRQRKIPLDVIVQDWNYWKPDHWGSPVPDATRFPDIAAMTKSVHDLDAHVMISIWPNPSPLDPPGRELKEGGYTSAGTDYVDFFQPKAADVYFRNVWKHLGRHGIDAWWCDSTEPEVADWTWDAKRPEHADALNVRGLSRVIDPQYLNAYALLDARGFMRNWRQAAPEKRLVNLTRSGYAGSQTTGAVTWTGDIGATWPVFAQQVTAVQSYSASGNPYVTFDIGAFFVHQGKPWFWKGDYEAGVADPGYRELYTRWLQFGAFLPMFRSHGTDTPREPWHFGEPGTPFYDAILQSIHLRYRLLPYVYSQSGLVHLNGASFIRPVAFAFPDDPRTHDLTTQMMFGDGIMVSPVTSPMYYAAGSVPIDGAAKTRAVYLPKGPWIDFWTGQSLAGGRTIMADAPISHMPIHVRAGSVIPMGPSVQHASEGVDAPIELRIYPGADGEYAYYEDAGEGWGYERGEYALVKMRWDDASRKLAIGRRQGSFPGLQPKRVFRIVVVGPADGHGIEPGGNSIDVVYDGDAVTVDTRRSTIKIGKSEAGQDH